MDGKLGTPTPSGSNFVFFQSPINEPNELRIKKNLTFEDSTQTSSQKTHKL